MDKFEICLRLGENNFDSLNLIQTIVSEYVRRGEAVRLKPRSYGNCRFPCPLTRIQLSQMPHLNLVVETGSATDWHGRNRPYAKFSFNVQRIAVNSRAGARLREVLFEIIANEGYERERIRRTFTAARHQKFLEHANREGVQAALAGTRGSDRQRRERMLESCRAAWWNPEQAWHGAREAVITTFGLGVE